MGICTVFILYGGLAFATVDCRPQLFIGDGVITPHEVVYISRIEQCWQDYGFYIARDHINLKHPYAKRVNYHHLKRRYRSRVTYHHRVRPLRRILHPRKRTVRRYYKRNGRLKRRVITRRY